MAGWRRSCRDAYAHTFDPFVALAAMAAVTERITLGTAVSLVDPARPDHHWPRRLPASTTSRGGRFLLGVGAGWNREEMAQPRHRPARPAGGLMREQMLAMQVIWTQDEAEFHGRLVDFDPVWPWPKPVQQPHPPILIGGERPDGARPLLEYGDGWIPLRIPVGRPRRVRRADRRAAARAAERGRGRIPVTVYGGEATAEALAAYAAAGVDRVLLELPDDDPTAVLHHLDTLATLQP